MPAGHIGRKSHRQCEGPDEHPHDLDRNQEKVERPGEPFRREVHPVLDEAMRLGAGEDDRSKGDRRQPGGDVVVRGRGRSAVQHLGDERIGAAVQDEAIHEPKQVKDRDQPDDVGGKDEQEERQDQRRPGPNPLAADSRFDHRVAHELDDRLEHVHQSRTGSSRCWRT